LKGDRAVVVDHRQIACTPWPVDMFKILLGAWRRFSDV
jgi:hypothetical protein